MITTERMSKLIPLPTGQYDVEKAAHELSKDLYFLESVANGGYYPAGDLSYDKLLTLYHTITGFIGDDRPYKVYEEGMYWLGRALAIRDKSQSSFGSYRYIQYATLFETNERYHLNDIERTMLRVCVLECLIKNGDSLEWLP